MSEPFRIRNDLVVAGDLVAESGARFGSTVYIPAAAGGTETVIDAGGTYYRVHTFLSSGAFEANVSLPNLEYLVVAGGGGGGENKGGAGGGGGGEVLTGSLNLQSGDYSAEVGEGGLGGDIDADIAGTDGASSSFASVTADGGKRGFSPGSIFNAGDGGDSGSGNAGGVGVQLTIDGINNAGTRAGGGGGGDSAPGETATGTSTDPDDRTRPNGGAGTSSSIDGTLRGYGGGGGGGSSQLSIPGLGADGGGNGGGNEINGQSGTPNTGGGGGGGGRYISGSLSSGNGGSGIVIVRYEITEAEYLAEVA